MIPGGWQQAEDANLQADVMRFMAIVAFCLIAILALVRQTLPSSDSRVEPSVPEALPSVQPPQEKIPSVASTSQPIPASEPVPVSAPTPKPKPAPVTDLEPGSAPAQTSNMQNDEGLSLRFASESDFLRLVSKNVITVYVYTDTKFLKLDAQYTFTVTDPPAQLYELNPTTIPATLRNTLPIELFDSELNWGVGLPARVERQIKQHLVTAKTGQLLINRFQEVKHVAASS